MGRKGGEEVRCYVNKGGMMVGPLTASTHTHSHTSPAHIEGLNNLAQC